MLWLDGQAVSLVDDRVVSFHGLIHYLWRVATLNDSMTKRSESDPVLWLKRPQWLFVGGSTIAAIVALIAEGPGNYIGLALLSLCVVVISAWSLIGIPSLSWTVAIVIVALITLGWTVEEPESALFQPIMVAAAVGWRIDRLAFSLTLLMALVLVPLVGNLGQNQADWAWWNWSVGTIFIWSLGRVIRLLEQTLTELREARTQLIDGAAREERLRISRDVHDLAGHSLTAMLLNIRAARRSLDSDIAEAHHALVDAERVGATGIADIRAALVDLRSDVPVDPKRADELSSLPDGDAVLRLLADQDHIAVSRTGDIVSLQGPLAVATYRILQECITNISKHAVASTGTITLVVSTSEILLTAANALRTEQTASSALSEKTLGLISMRERVTSLGGQFNAGIDGAEWKVTCVMPLHD